MPRNFHPPSTLIFFTPFAHLSFRWTVRIWGVISLLAFYASIYLIMRELAYERYFFLTIALVFWFPLWLHVRFGQLSTLILLFLTGTWLSLRRDRPALVGLFLALACLAKVFPGFILLFLLIKRRWKALLYSLLFLSVAAAALYLYYPDSISTFITKVAPENDRVFRSYFGNFSLNGFVGRLFNGTQGISPLFVSEQAETVMRTIGLAAVIILAAISSWKTEDLDLSFSVFVIVMLIVTPTTWAHSFVLLLLPGMILWRSVRRSHDRVGQILLLAALLLSSFPHWPYYEWLITITPAEPLPGWLVLTSTGFYVLIVMLTLALQQSAHSWVQPGSMTPADARLLPDGRPLQ